MKASEYTPRTKNLLHREFNQLTAIGFAGWSPKREAKWLWRCTCGNYKTLLACKVTKNAIKSCGCRTTRTHGHRVGRRATPEYCSWANMINRCYNESDPKFQWYGARGITVCDHWHYSFENFLTDVGFRPGPGYTIDRIKNHKGYKPDNCEWATRKQQARNSRHNTLLTYENRTQCVSAWAEEKNMGPATLRYRLVRGWSIERALTVPVRPMARGENNV